MATAPTFIARGDVYCFAWPADNIEAEVSRIGEYRDGISGEVVIRSRIHGLLYAGRLNLLSAPTHHVKTLNERLALDWFAMLQAMCFLSVEHYRAGEPPVALASVDFTSKPRWLLEPYVELGGPTVLFAEGGSGKSTLALAMAYTVATGLPALGKLHGPPVPVLYLDWETSAEVHAERLKAIAEAQGFGKVPENIYYRAMRSSLPEAAPNIRRDLVKLKAGMVAVDSLGAAGAGAPEESATAIALFGAMRTFEVPCLAVHHKRKQGAVKTNERDRLFGSVYFVNLARLVWEVDCAASEETSTLRLALINSKANNGRLCKRHGLELSYVLNGDERLDIIKIRQRNLADMDEFTERLSLRERCYQELRSGAKTLEQLVEATKLNKHQIRNRMNEDVDRVNLLRLAPNYLALRAS